MKIYIGNSVIEHTEAEELIGIGTGKTVYCIDERDDIYRTPERAMEEAETLADGWIGDLCVCEYKINLCFGQEPCEYALAYESDAPLAFTGRFWRKTANGWKEQ